MESSITAEYSVSLQMICDKQWNLSFKICVSSYQYSETPFERPPYLPTKSGLSKGLVSRQESFKHSQIENLPLKSGLSKGLVSRRESFKHSQIENPPLQSGLWKGEVSCQEVSRAEFYCTLIDGLKLGVRRYGDTSEFRDTLTDDTYRGAWWYISWYTQRYSYRQNSSTYKAITLIRKTSEVLKTLEV